MTQIGFDDLSFAVRKDITESQRRAWERISRHGTWWTGPERLAIAAEARNALDCPLCRERKQALSPRQVRGEHDSLGQLPAAAVEAAHAIRIDPGRLTRSWLEDVVGEEMTAEHYVELVGIVVTTVVVDTFARAVGCPVPPLPSLAIHGPPSRRRPRGARQHRHWVPTLAPEDVAEGELDPYADNRAANIHRALSLVPEEVIGFFDLGQTHYLSGAQMADLDVKHRAIDRVQIELLAARVSALNQCVY